MLRKLVAGLEEEEEEEKKDEEKNEGEGNKERQFWQKEMEDLERDFKTLETFMEAFMVRF